MKEYTYTVILMPSGSGSGYRAVCPLVPKCMARGETKEEAVRKLRAMLDRRLDRMIARGEPIPDVGRCKRTVPA